jgi:RNA polymerase sigma-70 factor, ECF subfamily
VKRQETELILEARAGSMRAFDALVDLHYSRCLRFASHQLGNRADAEEAVQDTFVRAWRSLDACAPERFGSWLMSILVNRCRTYGARTTRMHHVRDRFAEAQTDEVAEAETPVPVQIETALASLSPVLREAFLLKHVEDMTYEEIAAMTGVGVSALKMRVKRAGDELARALGESEAGNGC